MERDAIATGKTLDEAIETACIKLGVPREECDVEVLEFPKKKLFGLKLVPAKVKVTVSEEYENKFAVKEEKKPAQKVETPKNEQKKDKANKPKPEQKPAPKKAESPKEEKPCCCCEKKAEEDAPKTEEIKPLAEEIVNRKGGDAANYIKEVLNALGYTNADVKVSQRDGMIVLALCGEDMGGVVGRRGDNLDAMQYLASLIANKSEGSYVRVVLDVDDYRSKREASLRAYAKKVAAQVVRNQRSTTLEAMNPYERRIVHSTVQTVAGATSKSIGSEPNRRVVISPIEGSKFHGEGKKRYDNNRGGDRRNGGRGHGAQRHDSQRVYTPATNEPAKNDTSAISLYGRIDLD